MGLIGGLPKTVSEKRKLDNPAPLSQAMNYNSFTNTSRSDGGQSIFSPFTSTTLPFIRANTSHLGEQATHPHTAIKIEL